MVLRTGAESVYKKFTGQKFEPKKLMDKRVSRVVGWSLENDPSSQLTMRVCAWSGKCDSGHNL